MQASDTSSVPVQIRAGGVLIDGDLTVPPDALGLVVFAHGSGSSRFSRRNRAVAAALVRAGCATLLLDLLTPAEEEIDERTGEYRFDIARLAHRVIASIDWAKGVPALASLPVACFGASTGAAAALIAAAERPDIVRAVVSRADCRRSGRTGHCLEPVGDGRAARGAAGHRPGCDAPLRGTGGAGARGGTCGPLVHSPSCHPPREKRAHQGGSVMNSISFR
jgi:fermentation-respiration switch protein FrsA (DUF1100 family)